MIEKLTRLLGGPKSAPYVDAVLTAVAIAAAGWILKVFLDKIIRRIISKTQTTLDDEILGIIIPSLRWLTVVVALAFGLDQIQDAPGALTKAARQILLYVDHLLYLVGVVVITIFVIRIIIVSLGHVLHRYDSKTGIGVKETLNPLITRLVEIIGVFFALTVILERFDIDVSSLLVFLGGSSVAIALAAQDTLGNMIAGFVIMIDRPFRVGDRIKLPDGGVGDVYEIGLRSTRIMDFDNNLVISPNSELIKAKVINYAYPQRLIRVMIEVAVAYDTDIKHARKILLGLAKGHTDILPDPPPEVFVTALGDSAVTLTMIARTDDFNKKFIAESGLREQILESFRKEGIEIPLPQRSVIVRQERKGKKKK